MASSSLALAPQDAGSQRMGFTHLAISVESDDAVDALAARLRAEGVPVVDGPRRGRQPRRGHRPTPPSA